MRTLHMLHTLDVEVGEFTSTVRNGFKWADLKEGEEIELCVCTRLKAGGEAHQKVGVGKMFQLWFGRFVDIPARLIANEHEVQSRTYYGLLHSMKRAYGEEFNGNNPVTVVEYLRVQ